MTDDGYISFRIRISHSPRACMDISEIDHSQTTAHIELLKRLPPLRKREAELRQKSASGAGAEVGDETLVDDVKDRDWEDPRKKRKRRTELYTGVPTSDA